jgi:hypothetical protein
MKIAPQTRTLNSPCGEERMLALLGSATPAVSTTQLAMTMPVRSSASRSDAGRAGREKAPITTGGVSGARSSVRSSSSRAAATGSRQAPTAMGGFRPSCASAMMLPLVT